MHVNVYFFIVNLLIIYICILSNGFDFLSLFDHACPTFISEFVWAVSLRFIVCLKVRKEFNIF